jgi:hypothetical protein
MAAFKGRRFSVAAASFSPPLLHRFRILFSFQPRFVRS